MQESIYITDRKYKQEIGNTLTGNILISVSKKLYLNWQLQSVVLNIADQVKVVLNKNNLPCVFSDMFGRYQIVRSMSFVVTYFQIFFFYNHKKDVSSAVCVHLNQTSLLQMQTIKFVVCNCTFLLLNMHRSIVLKIPDSVQYKSAVVHLQGVKKT